jgi:putative transposase
LRDEILNGELFCSLHEAQVVIESWRREYNTIRPYSSLGYRPPAPDTIMSADPACAVLALSYRSLMIAAKFCKKEIP